VITTNKKCVNYKVFYKIMKVTNGHIYIEGMDRDYKLLKIKNLKTTLLML